QGFVGVSASYGKATVLTADTPLDLARRGASFPIALIHGERDTIPTEEAHKLRDALAVGRASASVILLDADHAGVIGTRFDEHSGRCVPSADLRPNAERVAEVIAAIALGRS